MKLLTDRRRLYAWLIMAVVVGMIVLGQQHYANRFRPERLLELPLNIELVKVENGQVYGWVYETPATNQLAVKFITRPGSTRKVPVMVETDIKEAPSPRQPVAMGAAQRGIMPGSGIARKTLTAFPVTGGKSREVGLDTVEAADSKTLWTTEIGTVQAYILPPPPQPSRLQASTGGARHDKYVPPPAPKPPFHIKTWRAPTDDLTLILRSARKGESTFTSSRNLSAGKLARGTDIDLHYAVAVAGGWLYWIEYAPADQRYRVSADGQYSSLPDVSHCSVMAAPINGGSPRKVAGNLSDQAMLISGTNGALCLTPTSESPYSKKITFLSATLPAHAIAATHDFGRVHSMDFQMPVGIDGSVFWIEKNAGEGAQTPRVAQPLMRTREDGSEACTTVQLPEAASMNSRIVDLVTHNRKLYVRMLEQSRHELNSSGTGHNTIYLLRNGAKPTFEKICQEPDGTDFTWYDGDYLYCMATETHEDLFDFSNAGLFEKSAKVLYRFHLPG